MKPGYQTTEFWLTIATSLAAICAALADVLPPKYAAVILSASSGLYAISRALAKWPQPGEPLLPPTPPPPPVIEPGRRG